MASINKAIILGNVGKDPEVKDGNSKIVNFSVATTRKYKDMNSQVQTDTEWHRCSAFGKLADVVERYVHKGSQIYVEGRLHTHKWTDKEGNDHYQTGIIAETIQLLGVRDQSNEAKGPPSNVRSTVRPTQQRPAQHDDSDDIPF